MTDLQVGAMSYSVDSGSFVANNRVYDAIHVEKISTEVTNRRTKVLILTMSSGDRIFYESARKKLLGGYGSTGSFIEDFVRIFPELKKTAEKRHAAARKRDDEINRKCYAFLVKSTSPFAELIAADIGAHGVTFATADTHTSRIFAMPCGVRGCRLLTIYHDDNKIQVGLCNAARAFFGERIIQEGRLKQCDINHAERRMGRWEFMDTE